MPNQFKKAIFILIFLLIAQISTKQVFAVEKSQIRSYYELAIFENHSQFPIQKARPLNRNSLGCFSNKENYPFLNESPLPDLLTDSRIKQNMWFTQHSNDNGDFCQGKSNFSLCPENSDINLFSNTGGICFSKSKKEASLVLNTSKQPYNGCYVNSNTENVNNPGGYDIYSMYNATKLDSTTYNKYFNLTDSEAITLTSKVKNVKYSETSCPQLPANAILYGEKKPASLILSSLLLYNESKKTSLFYNISLWDNRPEYRNQKTSPKTICNFPTTVGGASFYLMNDSIYYYDLPPAETKYTETIEYKYDILPRIIAGIKECDPTDSINNWRITQSYVGVENVNATDSQVTFINPKITITLKNTNNEFSPVYEVFCQTNLDYVYLNSKEEVDGAISNGCLNKGIIGYASKTMKPGLVPLYRLWSPKYLDNFYTATGTEKDAAVVSGWQLIGIIGYIPASQEKNTKPLYRIQNATSKPTGIDRILTTLETKKNFLQSLGNYQNEGIIGYLYQITDSNILGDLNKNGSIDSSDIKILQENISNILQNKASLDDFDLNYDGKIGLKDVLLFL